MYWPIEGHSDQLSWNPTMYLWRTQGCIEGAKLVQFFKYNTEIGKQIILEQEHDKIATHKFWIQEGIHERRLDKFWKMIWHDSNDRKIMMCLWFIAHWTLLVGMWGKGPNVDPRCTTCGQLESISHCLWECREATVVGHYVCYALPLGCSPSIVDMLARTVLRMMLWNMSTCKAIIEGRMELFDDH